LPVTDVCSGDSQSLSPQQNSPIEFLYPPLLIHESWANAAKAQVLATAKLIAASVCLADMAGLICADHES